MNAKFFDRVASPRLHRAILGDMTDGQNSTIGRVLRALRTEARMSPDELAEESGVSRATIYRIEGGETADPDLPTLRALARALDVPLSTVFARVEGEPYAGQEEHPTKKRKTDELGPSNLTTLSEGLEVGSYTAVSDLSPEQYRFADRLIFHYLRAAAAARRLHSIALFEDLAVGVAMATSEELLAATRAAIDVNRNRLAERQRSGRRSTSER